MLAPSVVWIWKLIWKLIDSVYQYFIPFYAEKYCIECLFHVLVINVSIDRLLDCIHFLGIRNIVMNICVQAFCGCIFLILLGINLVVELLNVVVTLYLVRN